MVYEIIEALSLQAVYEWLGFIGALYVIRILILRNYTDIIKQIRSRYKECNALEDMVAAKYNMRARTLRRLQAAEMQYKKWEAQYLARSRDAEKKAIVKERAHCYVLLKDHHKEFAACVIEEMRAHMRASPRRPTDTDIQKALDCI